MTASILDRVCADIGIDYSDNARQDILVCLASFKDLHPVPDTVLDGVAAGWSQRRVVALKGTIPVVIAEATYNIPVCLYLLPTHPYHAPLCYVKRATSNMVIKPSCYVDKKGRIYNPYLTDWAFPACSTLDLVQLLIVTFADNCPVFDKGGPGLTLPAHPSHPFRPIPRNRPPSPGTEVRTQLWGCGRF